MKIIEAINQIDSLKRNTYSQSDKIRWLSRLDLMIWRLIISTHEGIPMVPEEPSEEDAEPVMKPMEFHGYDDSTPADTELLAYAPFDQMYLNWMEAQIDYENGEFDRYNNAIVVFNTCFGQFRNDYNAHHKALTKGTFRL